MSAILGSSLLRTEWLQRLRDDRQANLRLAALLVTVVLHALLIWWGINFARLGAPSPEKVQAIRVFLQPLALPELAAVVRPPRSLPAVASPAAPPTPVLLPRVAAPPSPLPPVTPAISPTPLVAPPAPVASPEVAVSLAPLPVAVSVVVPAVPVAAVAANPASPHGGSESGAAHLASIGNASAGGGESIGTAVPNGAIVAGAGGGAAGSGKELYLRALFSHIEAHKYYPPSARRRQLEGQVRVAFTIEPGGGVSNLKVSEGHPQLEEAALQTVRSALPLPLPAGGVGLPFNLSYRMDFRLR